MKRLTLILALAACLGPVGASADTILVPHLGRSGIPGFHSETWDGGVLYVDRIKIGANNRSPLGDDILVAADFTALSTWDDALSMMLGLPVPGDQPSVALHADAALPSPYAGDVTTNVNDSRTWKWFTADDSTRTRGWAWAWGHTDLNGDAIGREHSTDASAVVTPAVVTEPGSLVLVGTGLFLLAGTARRRRRS